MVKKTHIRMNRLKQAALTMLILLHITVLPVQAVDNTQSIASQEKSQIIFLIDGSYSMTGEPWKESLDCIQAIDAMLPSDFQTALLVYSDGVDISVDFDQLSEDSIAELGGRKLQGYSNPGEALGTALEMFDWNSSGGKYVVLISDGEISMRTAEDTEAAITIYRDVVSQAADNGVVIDLLLYETAGIEDQISDCAAMTGGTSYYRTKDSTAEKFAESYLFDCLGLERVMLGLADSSNNVTTVSLQDTYAKYARILLTSETSIQDIHVSCQSKEIQVVQGEKFAVITLDHPMEETVNLVEFVEELFLEELGLRDENRWRRLIKRAGFPVYKTFEGYSYDSVKFPPTFGMEGLDQLDFVPERKNLVLYGQIGIGKTHMAIAAG